jgi:signal transduction histidine kinase
VSGRHTRTIVARGVYAFSLLLTGLACVLWFLNAQVTSGVVPIQVFAVPGFGLVGAAVAERSRNLIGRLFLSLAVVGSMTAFTFGYALRALGTAPGSLPFGGIAAAISNAGYPFTYLVFGLTLLLFPDGRLPSPRWKPLALSYMAIAGFTTVASLFVPKLQLGNYSFVNPIGFRGPTMLVDYDGAPAIATVFTILMFVLLLSTAAAPIVRRRAADAETRQQLRWLALVLEVILALSLVAAVLALLHEDLAVAIVGVGLLFAIAIGIPVAIGIAVLKYRLYDIDLVIRKTVVFGLLAVFITGVYAAIVGMVSLRFGDSQVGSFLAAIALAVLFAPARDRARKIADRFVYGRRATPYEVLAEFSDRVGGAYAADDVLHRMAQVLEEGTGASGARVLLRVGTERREAASIGEQGEETVVEVTHQGEELGALAVSMPAADPMNPAKLQLVEDLAAQAGLVLRNVKLIEELKASRQRLVAAQDEERRKIERNIHDGAQQQLVALAVQLRLAGSMVGKDPDKERELLVALAERTNEALEDLRDLARGIYPPLLQDKGLPAALETQARKAVVPTTVEADGIGRFDRATESAVYFSCLEAMQNIAKYAEASRAEITLARGEDRLMFTVTDDGRGFDPARDGYGTGLQGIADRLAVLDGRLRVESSPNRGTLLFGEVPV